MPDFVDETGGNTNQLNDGKVGGELHIMPKNIGDAAPPAGATTDIHFTQLAFHFWNWRTCAVCSNLQKQYTCQSNSSKLENTD
jgi:hypothetical protein